MGHSTSLIPHRVENYKGHPNFDSFYVHHDNLSFKFLAIFNRFVLRIRDKTVFKQATKPMTPVVFFHKTDSDIMTRQGLIDHLFVVFDGSYVHCFEFLEFWVLYFVIFTGGEGSYIYL
jgi:hypothetical protein